MATSAGTKRVLGLVALGVGVIIVVVLGLRGTFSTKSGSPAETTAEKKDNVTKVTLRGRVPINVDVPVPKYRVVMEMPAGTEAAAVAPAPKPTPRPAVPTPSVAPPTPPAPKKAETTKLLVLNGLTSSVEIRYRTEGSFLELGTEGGASRTLEPGEEALIEGVVMGEVLTARIMDPAGKVSGTYHCRVIPGPGPVRMWHILQYTQLRK